MNQEEYLSPDYVFNQVCAFSKDGNCLGNKKLNELKSKAELVGSKELLSKINAAIADPTNSKLQKDIIHHSDIFKVLTDDEYIDTLIKGFKAPAPQGNKLFSNFNEDLILRQLNEAVPTFKNYNCVLMDFHTHGGEPLTQAAESNSELIKGIKSGDICSFGTIPNTLVSTGDTSKVGHWVALFGDFRDNDLWTIEYYNSTGNSAPSPMFKWMEKLAKAIEDDTNHKCIALNVSNVASQSGPSECGIYSLHYLLCRLMGISYKEFRKDKIPDATIEKMRKLFDNVEELPGPVKNKLRNYGYA